MHCFRGTCHLTRKYKVINNCHYNDTIPCALRHVAFAVWQYTFPHYLPHSNKNKGNTRWFKYDRDRFVCKQAALRSSCATLREWSHNLHPPSCSGYNLFSPVWELLERWTIMVTKNKISPVIFEPLCIIFHHVPMIYSQNNRRFLLWVKQVQVHLVSFLGLAVNMTTVAYAYEEY